MNTIVLSLALQSMIYSAGVEQLTLVADFPHLLVPQSKAVQMEISKAYSKSTKLNWADMVKAQNLGMKGIHHATKSTGKDKKTGEVIGVSDFYVTRRFAKSDPPPTKAVISDLSAAVAGVMRNLTMLNPNDKLAPEVADSDMKIKLLILVEWRAGWCDGSFRDGKWITEEPGNFFSGAVPLDTGLDLTVLKDSKRFSTMIHAANSTNQPLVQNWVAAFRDPETGRVASRQEHSRILVDWWKLRAKELHSAVLRALPGSEWVSLKDRLIIEVRAYDPLRVNSETKSKVTTQSKKAVIWLSQSGVRGEWGGAQPFVSKPAIKLARKKHVTFDDALKLIRSSRGSWRTNQHRLEFCQLATANLSALTNLGSMMQVVPGTRSFRTGSGEQSRTSYFPDKLFPINMVAGVNDLMNLVDRDSYYGERRQ